jgi:hypothetical protein
MIVVLPNANWHDSWCSRPAARARHHSGAARLGAAALPVQDYTIAEQEIVTESSPRRGALPCRARRD